MVVVGGLVSTLHCRPVRSSKTGEGSSALEVETLHVHTYLIIVIHINIRSLNTKGRVPAYMNKRKLQLNGRLITCLNAALSREGFVFVFINRSIIPRFEITLADLGTSLLFSHAYARASPAHHNS